MSGTNASAANNAAAAAAPADNNTTNSGHVATTASQPNEEELRRQLRSALRSLNRREPLDGTYKRLLMNNGRLAAPPILPKDKTYRRVGADWRARVEQFMEATAGQDPLDRLRQRQPLEDNDLRAALTLREAKEHEQQALLEATLASFPRRHGMDPVTRKRHLDSIALGLQSSRRPKLQPQPKNAKQQQQQQRAASPKGSSAGGSAISSGSHAEQTEQARRQAELDRLQTQARAREAARKEREQQERAAREREMLEAQRARQRAETPKQALHKLYSPIFKVLWNMEFAHLGSTNPFRMVIDRDNCASVGAPDYFDVITKAMNLTYIKQKVDAMEYETFAAFMADVELMLKNAILYNSDQQNPYRIAAEEMKKKYIRMAKKVIAAVKSKKT